MRHVLHEWSDDGNGRPRKFQMSEIQEKGTWMVLIELLNDNKTKMNSYLLHLKRKKKRAGGGKRHSGWIF